MRLGSSSTINYYVEVCYSKHPNIWTWLIDSIYDSEEMAEAKAKVLRLQGETVKVTKNGY